MTGHIARVHDLTPRGRGDERLSVVSELCPAEEAIPDGYSPFLPGAVAPRGEWRVPTPDELSSLVGDPGVHDDSDVLVVTLPRLTRVLGDHLRCRRDFSFLHKAVRDVAFVRALEGCIDDLIPFCTCPDGLVCQGAWVSPGGCDS